MVKISARKVKAFIAGLYGEKISPLVRQLPWILYRLIISSGRLQKSVSPIFKKWPIQLQVPADTYRTLSCEKEFIISIYFENYFFSDLFFLFFWEGPPGKLAEALRQPPEKGF
jgi:hypothetical protein